MPVTTMELQLEYFQLKFIHYSKNTKPRKPDVFLFSVKKNLEGACVKKIISHAYLLAYVSS